MSKLVLSSIRTDLARIRKGDWVPAPYAPWKTVKARFNVSTLNLPAYQLAVRRVNEKLASKYAGDPVDPDELHAENGALLAEHILHGWENLDVEYTPEIALDMLCDPSYDALNTVIRVCAMKLEETKAEFIKAAEKN